MNLAFVSHLELSIEVMMYKAEFVAFNMTSFRQENFHSYCPTFIMFNYYTSKTPFG